MGKNPEAIAKIESQGVRLQDLGPDALNSYIRAQMENLQPVLSNIAETAKGK